MSSYLRLTPLALVIVVGLVLVLPESWLIYAMIICVMGVGLIAGLIMIENKEDWL